LHTSVKVRYGARTKKISSQSNLGCQRCQRETSLTTGSYFNTQMLCSECSAEEARHPDYEYARTVEGEAVRGGDYNYPGVGWPGKNGRVRR